MPPATDVVRHIVCSSALWKMIGVSLAIGSWMEFHARHSTTRFKALHPTIKCSALRPLAPCHALGAAMVGARHGLTDAASASLGARRNMQKTALMQHMSMHDL